MAQLDDKCGICGRKGRSLCVSLGTMICSLCCGSKRGTKIVCSGECQYSPFSVKGYDLWLRIDDALSKKIMNYVFSHYNQKELDDSLKRMAFKDKFPDDTFADAITAGSAIYYLLFIKKDNNKTMAHQWKNQGWQGLTNDERMMMDCRIDNSYATIIEIQKILDYQTMECIDLLDPERGKFILLDRCTAKSAVRFTQLLTWLNHYPHFSRIANNALYLSDMIAFEFMDTLLESFKKELRKRRELTVKQYLSENFGHFCELLSELGREKAKAMYNNMDLHQCKAFYVLVNKFEEVKTILDKYPEFSPRERNPEEEEHLGAYYYSWLRRGASKELEQKMPAAFRHEDESRGVGSIGNVSLHPDKLIIETFTRQKYDFAKKMIKKYFKSMVTLKNEMVVDLAKQFAETIEERRMEPLAEKTSSIPREIEQKLMRDFYKENYKKFLDEKIPMLNGMTPRQASKKPAMRLQLINLMKIHLKGIETQNRKRNFGLNIDWVLDELGLSELK